jgi:hypothetical protein
MFTEIPCSTNVTLYLLFFLGSTDK